MTFATTMLMLKLFNSEKERLPPKRYGSGAAKWLLVFARRSYDMVNGWTFAGNGSGCLFEDKQTMVWISRSVNINEFIKIFHSS